MKINKCDICKKEVDRKTIIEVSVGYLMKEFCVNCGSPVLKFLKKHKLIKKEENAKK